MRFILFLACVLLGASACTDNTNSQPKTPQPAPMEQPIGAPYPGGLPRE